ncbi:hypothetical protein [Pseudomonas simiae]|uniref:hypothetical protein n=1 Tax=Pseudomonas simiae TaxID=321846 RepID=UPI0016544985|nr:hypothetical protein [Pseudomonas simiae]MBC3964318.1 hypothetical protein [Pseudomonas simiae]
MAISDVDWQLTKDVFSIAGTIASVLGVGLAFYIGLVGLSTWKRQLRGAADHKLARDAATAIYKYKTALVLLWGYASSAAMHTNDENWIASMGEDSYSRSIYQPHIDKAEQARADLEPIAIECAAIFGGVFVEGFQKLYQFESKCASCIHSYLYLMSRVGCDEQAIEVSEDSIKAWAKFAANGIDSIESSKVFIEKLISPMLNELEKRLLKDIQ